MQRVDVVGYRYQDIVLYAAQILAAMGEKVFIRDMTTDWELLYYVPLVQGIGATEVLELRGVNFGFGKQKKVGETDYLFTLWEPEQCINSIPFSTDDEGMLLAVTDEEPTHEAMMEEVFELQGFPAGYTKRSALIFKDYSGINKDLCFETRESLKGGLFAKLPYNKRDREAEVFLWVREDPVFKPITERMASLLEDIVCRIRPNTQVAEFERAFRNAMKGGAR